MTGPSNRLNEEEIELLSLLLALIDSQNWQAFGYVVRNDPTAFRSFAQTVSQSSQLNGMTILHACLRSNPPPCIIKNLIELVPESLSRIDCLQRTPLHVAAGTRSSLPTITLLAEAFPGACGIQDIDGKTPLHLACDSACKMFEGDGDNSARELPRYEVVETLIEASPLSVALEDQDGMSALEHAIFSNAPITVIKLLQYATRRQCEAQEKGRHVAAEKIQSQESSCFGMTETQSGSRVFDTMRGAMLENRV